MDDWWSLRNVRFEGALAAAGPQQWEARPGAGVIYALIFPLLGERPVDVLVADIGLPVVDGFDLLRAVRSSASFESLPAIAVTGFASEEDRVRATAAGYAAHLPKPVDADALARTIARVVPAAKRPPRSS